MNMFQGSSSFKLDEEKKNSSSPFKYPENGTQNAFSYGVLNVRVEKPQQSGNAIPKKNIETIKLSPPSFIDPNTKQIGKNSPYQVESPTNQNNVPFNRNYFAKGIPTVYPQNSIPHIPASNKAEIVNITNEMEIKTSDPSFNQGYNPREYGLNILPDNRGLLLPPSTNPEDVNNPIEIEMRNNPNDRRRIKNNSISTIPHMPANAAPVIKKVTNKDILNNINSIIERLVPLVDLNKVIKKREQINNFIENTKSPSNSSVKIFSEIFQRLKCSRCASANPMIQLSCQHLFCQGCTNHLNVSMQAEFYRTSLSCSICHQELTDPECSFLLKESGLSIEKNFFTEKLKRDKWLQCFKCAQQRHYFDIDTCMHMCKDCIAANIRDSKVTCDVCEVRFNSIENIIQEKILCGGCKEAKYFVGDRYKYIHNDRCALCALCLNVTLNQGDCRCCRAKLSRLEKLEINQHLFDFCQGCNSERYRGELNKCRNCKFEICHECLNTPNSKCSNCGFDLKSE